MLTPFQTKKLTHYFHTLDFDSSDTVEKEDYTKIGYNLCELWGLSPSSEKYNYMISRYEGMWNDLLELIGEEHIEHITLNDWLQFADKFIVNGTEDQYDKFVSKLTGELFDFFDTNEDGLISPGEYIDMFVAYGIERNYSMNVFESLDLNGDKAINKEELLLAVRNFFRSDNPDEIGNQLFGKVD